MGSEMCIRDRLSKENEVVEKGRIRRNAAAAVVVVVVDNDVVARSGREGRVFERAYEPEQRLSETIGAEGEGRVKPVDAVRTQGGVGRHGPQR